MGGKRACDVSSSHSYCQRVRSERASAEWRVESLPIWLEVETVDDGNKVEWDEGAVDMSLGGLPGYVCIAVSHRIPLIRRLLSARCSCPLNAAD